MSSEAGFETGVWSRPSRELRRAARADTYANHTPAAEPPPERARPLARIRSGLRPVGSTDQSRWLLPARCSTRGSAEERDRQSAARDGSGKGQGTGWAGFRHHGPDGLAG